VLRPKAVERGRRVQPDPVVSAHDSRRRPRARRYRHTCSGPTVLIAAVIVGWFNAADSKNKFEAFTNGALLGAVIGAILAAAGIVVI
jgi:hypothetical protein